MEYGQYVEKDDIITSVTVACVQLANHSKPGSYRLVTYGSVFRERMTTQDVEAITPQHFINIRPVVASIRSSSKPVVTIMDQTTIISLTHKRRLSALGPGGSRDRAGFEVRDVTHLTTDVCVQLKPGDQTLVLLAHLPRMVA